MKAKDNKSDVWKGTWLEGKSVELIVFSKEDLDKTILCLDQAGFNDIKTRILFQLKVEE